MFMKKKLTTLFIGALSFFAMHTVSAQNFIFGIKAGGNVAMGKVKSIYTPLHSITNNAGFGYYVGAFMETSCSKLPKLKGQIEVLYDFTSVGASAISERFHTIRIPVMVKYELCPKFNVGIGPNVGFNVASSIYSSLTEETQSNVRMNTVQFGALLNLSYKFCNNFSVDMRYNQHISNVGKKTMYTTNDNFNYNTIQLGLSYKF